MKKFVLCMLLSGCFVTLSFGQSSIGIKNKHNLQSVLAYRLPTWGYSTLYLRANGRANRVLRKDSEYEKSKQYQYDFALVPSLNNYRESEAYILSYRGSIGLSSSYSFNQETNDRAMVRLQEDKNTRNRLSLNLSADWQGYFAKNRFILLGGQWFYNNLREETKKVIQYDPDSGNENIDEASKEDRKNYFLQASVGFGFGRIRDVTPLIRAARLRERYRVLQNNVDISESELQRIAQEIAQVTGYNIVYDRPGKYFWDNVLKHVPGISDRTPFEIYYLSDVLRENIGTRFEGWDVSFAATGEKFSANKPTVGFIAQGRWIRNLTLEQQLGVTIKYNFMKNFDKDLWPSKKYGNIFDLYVSYLYTLSDRILWESAINGSFDFFTRERESSPDTDSYLNQFYTIASSFSYFIENSVRLNVNFEYKLDRFDKELNSPESRDDFRFSFGLSYYFTRKLF